MPGQATGARQERRIVVTGTGLGPGTRIATADGMIPVEFLEAGERIVTRAGMRRLRRLSFRLLTGPAVRVSAGTLGFDRPGYDLLLAESQPVRIADWRAGALWGVAEGIVPVSQLVDGVHIARVAVRGVRMFTLHFERPEVITADGVACLSGAPVPAIA